MAPLGGAPLGPGTCRDGGGAGVVLVYRTRGRDTHKGTMETEALFRHPTVSECGMCGGCSTETSDFAGGAPVVSSAPPPIVSWLTRHPDSGRASSLCPGSPRHQAQRRPLSLLLGHLSPPAPSKGLPTSPRAQHSVWVPDSSPGGGCAARRGLRSYKHLRHTSDCSTRPGLICVRLALLLTCVPA
ncbi:hypothetical protein HJG60_011771 [Phyllostomus discolor]|uniref:Uncharacterized protein n=1 Tax=Phyllostomus discolor TaxID=89673 RepID=A0A834DVX2_9CHIR|nr:hypothetical protein HJG60_011771 [Phyllostomus discolor]